MQSLQHRQTWDLIPWLVNGTASTVDQAQAEAHLSTCSDCRDEYAFQSRLHAGLLVQPSGESPANTDAQPALQRLLARIDVDEPVQNATQSSSFAQAAIPRRRLVRALAAAVVVQAIGLAGLAAWALDHNATRGAEYRTLSAPEALATGALVRFVPSPELSVGQMQRLLSENGLHVVGTNDGGTIYSLAPIATLQGSDASAVVARLRATPGVLLAEPIATSNAR
jgi:hypothetical protein